MDIISATWLDPDGKGLSVIIADGVVPDERGEPTAEARTRQVVVPADEANGHYREVLAWLSAGGEIAEHEPPVAQPETVITPLAFRERFTEAEQDAIYAAAASSSALMRWLDTLRLATRVGLEDERTIAGVEALVAAGLITEARGPEILTP